MTILSNISDKLKGKVPAGTKRSNQWPTVRAAHLALHPVCELCGGIANLEVHHIKPFHLHPELELDPTNLITLCESKKGGVNCHLFFGHLGNFRSFNVTVPTDTPTWHVKILTRPSGDIE